MKLFKRNWSHAFYFLSLISLNAHAFSLIQGSGYYRADVAVVTLPAHQVVKMLPKELQLSAKNGVKKGRHPVILLFGSHEGVLPMPFELDRTNYRAGINYNEFILGVPFVEFKDGRSFNQFVYMPKLFLDKEFPIFLGTFYGFAKEKAQIEKAPNSYLVKTLSDQGLIVSAETALGVDYTQKEMDQDFILTRSIFLLPHVGEVFDGHFLCSEFIWKTNSAQFSKTELKIEVQKEFVPGLETKSFKVGPVGVKKDHTGAFHIESAWNLTSPHECE